MYTAIKHTPQIDTGIDRYLADKTISPIWKHFADYTGKGKYLYIFFLHFDMMSRNNLQASENGRANFFLLLDDQVLADISNNVCKLVFEYTDEQHDFFYNKGHDLSMLYITNTIKRYNLQRDQVIVCTGNLKAQTQGWPFHAVILNRWYHSAIKPVSLNYINKQTKIIQNKTPRKKKLMCLMRRARSHRLWVAEKLFLKDLVKDNHVSMSIDQSNTNFVEHISKNFNKRFIESLPWIFDVPVKQEFADCFNEPVYEINENLYLDVYAHLVVETWLGHSAINVGEMSLTEKTIKPIAAMQPFILATQPGSLEFLRSEGYKTFSQWWDESYDTESEPYRRLELCVNIFEKLNNLTHEQLSNMLYEMLPTLKHNEQLYREKFTKQENLNNFLDVVNLCFNKQ